MFIDFETIHWAGTYLTWHIIVMMSLVVFTLSIKSLKFYNVVQTLVPTKWKKLLLKNASLIRYACKSLLFFVGFLCLMLALLQPQWDKTEEKVEQEGRDLLIAVDISRSMLAQDEKPNRLEFTKQKIKKLLYNLSCERVGLLLFAGSTVLQCPLTTDYPAFFMFLDQLDAETFSPGTTSIDQAIRHAMNVFESMPTKKTKLLCLFTDGEDFSTNLTGVKEKAAQQGLSIFTFGVGSEHGAPIPVLDQYGKQQGFEKDDKDNVVMSKLNEGILRNLSQQTGGYYIHAKTSDKDIQELIGRVESFDKDKFDDKTIGRLQEKYNYFVIPSLVCFALEWLL